MGGRSLRSVYLACIFSSELQCDSKLIQKDYQCVVTSSALCVSCYMIVIILFYSYWHTHLEQRAEFGMLDLVAIYSSFSQ